MEFTRRLVIAVVAGVAALEAWFQAIAETFNGRLDLFILWLVGGLLMFFAVDFVENLKTIREG